MSFATTETGGSGSLLSWRQVRLPHGRCRVGCSPGGPLPPPGPGALLGSLLHCSQTFVPLWPVVAVASPGPQAGCFCPCRAAGAPSSVARVAAPGPPRCPQPRPERLLVCEWLLGQNSRHLCTAVSSQSLPPPRCLSLSVSLKSCIFLFIHFCLCWVSLAAWALPSCGERGCSPRWLPFLRSRGSRAGPVVVTQGQRCSTTRGVFPGQGSKPGLLHWQVDSLPLSHQGSPPCYFKRKKGTAPSNHACGIQPTH